MLFLIHNLVKDVFGIEECLKCRLVVYQPRKANHFDAVYLESGTIYCQIPGHLKFESARPKQWKMNRKQHFGIF